MLSFDDKDDFYFVQIFKRRKDNPDLGKDQIVLDNFYIDSLDDFDKKLPYIISICDKENARAYLRVNRRNYKKLAPHFLQRVVGIVFTENCRALRNTYHSVAGEFHAETDKKWIVDADDDKEFAYGDLCTTLSMLQKEAGREVLMIHVPTKNGFHLITRPFNLQHFRKTYPTIDVHKDNPTILYCP